jgi:putative endonuclease
VLAQNVRCPLGEIDLVARDGPTLVFVEVKSRSSAAFGLPQEAVTKDKQRRLTRLAWWYLKMHRLQHCSARFDVIAITWQETDPRINWIVNAFEATS